MLRLKAKSSEPRRFSFLTDKNKTKRVDHSTKKNVEILSGHGNNSKTMVNNCQNNGNNNGTETANNAPNNNTLHADDTHDDKMQENSPDENNNDPTTNNTNDENNNTCPENNNNDDENNTNNIENNTPAKTNTSDTSTINPDSPWGDCRTPLNDDDTSTLRIYSQNLNGIFDCNGTQLDPLFSRFRKPTLRR